MGYEAHPGYPENMKEPRLEAWPPITAQHFLDNYLRSPDDTAAQKARKMRTIAIHLGLLKNVDDSVMTASAFEQLEPLFHLLAHPQGKCLHQTLFYDFRLGHVEDLLEYIINVGPEVAAAEFKWDGERVMLERGFRVFVDVITHMIEPFVRDDAPVVLDENVWFGQQVEEYWRHQESGVSVMDLARAWGLGYKDTLIRAFILHYEAYLRNKDGQGRQPSVEDSLSSGEN